MKNKNIFPRRTTYPYAAIMLKNAGNFWYASLYRNSEQVDYKRKLSAWSAFKKMVKVRNKLNDEVVIYKDDNHD